MASKVLSSAIELGLFTALAGGPMDVEQLQARLKVHSRGLRDFLDTLVSAAMLERHGEIYRTLPKPVFI
jgi:predicted transcriptional regulator